MKAVKPVLITILSLSIVACAGKQAQPVSAYKVGDEAMSCNELKAEMAHIDSKVAQLIPESEKTGKNVALGVAGWFLIVPWFFMDLSDSEKVEIEAYKERYLALEKQCVKKSCSTEPSQQVAEQQTGDTSARLAALKDLEAKGLISADEYEVQRKEIISGI